MPRVVPDRRRRRSSLVAGADGRAPARARLLTFLPGRTLDYDAHHGRRSVAPSGAAIGRLSLALDGFEHPGADRVLAWDLQHVGVAAPAPRARRRPARPATTSRAELDRFDAVTGAGPRGRAPPGGAQRRQRRQRRRRRRRRGQRHPRLRRHGAHRGGRRPRGRDGVRRAAPTAASTPTVDPWRRRTTSRTATSRRTAARRRRGRAAAAPRARPARAAPARELLARRDQPRPTPTTPRARSTGTPRRAAPAGRRRAAAPPRGRLTWASPATVGPSTYFDPANVDELDPADRRPRAPAPRRARPGVPALLPPAAADRARRGRHLYDADGVGVPRRATTTCRRSGTRTRAWPPRSPSRRRCSTRTRATCTRAIVRYAEQLLATLPDELGHVMFTCTGSEAERPRAAHRQEAHRRHGRDRDAQRLPRRDDRDRRDLAVARRARRPRRLGRAGSARRTPTASTAAPGTPSLGEWFAAQVQDGDRRPRRARHPVRRLRADSVFASDGVLRRPGGFLAPVREVVAPRRRRVPRRRGAARLRPHRRHVLGLRAPRRCGRPVRARPRRPSASRWATAIPSPRRSCDRRSWSEFGRDMRYFNTFGGNAVAIAAAQAVLDVVRDEGLQENARVVGGQLQVSLRELASRHPASATCAAPGCSSASSSSTPDGVPEARTSRSPWSTALRDRHVLRRHRRRLHNNVLKVRPPLVLLATPTPTASSPSSTPSSPSSTPERHRRRGPAATPGGRWGGSGRASAGSTSCCGRAGS